MRFHILASVYHDSTIRHDFGSRGAAPLLCSRGFVEAPTSPPIARRTGSPCHQLSRLLAICQCYAEAGDARLA